ncbi:hypothetical protein N7G274_007921 [Stereocaulon virgatum]|uniref:Uncharacterized protein n=1 Tax=Stereocaulon virgatum TaxID=373712 RepID=A0ABR4A0W8_9LECA
MIIFFTNRSTHSPRFYPHVLLRSFTFKSEPKFGDLISLYLTRAIPRHGPFVMIENGHYGSALILVPSVPWETLSRSSIRPSIWHGWRHPLLGLPGYLLESAIRDWHPRLSRV